MKRVLKHRKGMLRAVVEASSLEMFKEHLDVTLSALVWVMRWGLVTGWTVIISEVFSNLNDSVIL